jgi:hypothetical protein
MPGRHSHTVDVEFPDVVVADVDVELPVPFELGGSEVVPHPARPSPTITAVASRPDMRPRQDRGAARPSARVDIGRFMKRKMFVS